ncbi:MAG: hypothetical protein JXA92_02060 [candidate division Zixibacteria bacterium]|nr:hypothetical protein [candidate division Zixibacteria bacterium]
MCPDTLNLPGQLFIVLHQIFQTVQATENTLYRITDLVDIRRQQPARRRQSLVAKRLTAALVNQFFEALVLTLNLKFQFLAFR